MNSQKAIKLTAVAVGILTLLVITLFILDRDRPLGQGYKQADEYGGEFSLQSDTGQISLSDLRGKVVVLYFGFVSCRDACPVSLAKMRTAFNRLNADELAQTQGVFISIDPERDLPDDLAAYVKNYHNNFIGLTGSRAIINDVLEQYGVFASKNDLNGESTTYTVDHYSRFYLIDKEGNLETTLSHSTTPAELVAKIKSML